MCPKPTFISKSVENSEVQAYIELLKDYMDVFAWGYEDMPGLDPKVVVHKLAVSRSLHPVKQGQRCMRQELQEKVEEEVRKLIKVGFIREVQYPTWIANIVPVKKKSG